jgi:hypothetical protein
MIRYNLFSNAVILILLISGVETVEAQKWIQLESGIAISGYNDVQSPGTTGTRFSLSEELEADPSLFFRLRLGWRINEKHAITLLAAPLRFNSTGSLDRDLIYEGVTFPAGTALAGTYRFDSYRFTWRRTMRGSDRFQWSLGVTGKIRAAAITIEGGGQESEKPNVGFVPLINFAFAWKTSDRLSVIVEGDALAAPQGRAEDVLFGARYAIDDRIEAYGGYRILEGGADVDEVYTFALINYFSAGIRISF